MQARAAGSDRSRRRPRRVVALAVAGVAAACAAPAAAAAATTLQCGDTVTRSVKLAADVSCADEPVALHVGADGITLDLGGHTVASQGAVGIAFDGHRAVRLRNGVVAMQGFNEGVVADGDAAGIQRLTSTGGGIGIRLAGNGARVSDSRQSGQQVAGLFAPGDDLTVVGNASTEVTADLEGSFPLGLQAFGRRVTVRNSRFLTSPNFGIELDQADGSLIAGNRFTSRGTTFGGGGVDAEDSAGVTVAGNRFEFGGLQAIDADGLRVLGNLMTNGFGGFFVSAGNGVLIRGNRVQEQVDDGFAIQGITGLVMEDNVAGSTNGATGANGIGIELLDVTGVLRRNSANGSRGGVFGGLQGDTRGDGIRVYGGDVDLIDNVANRNAANGIRDAGAGSIERNNANANAETGIELTGTATDGGHNRAAGNGVSQCVGLVCTP